MAEPRMIDVTQAPYNADPSGKVDATEALRRALNDVTALTLGAFGQTLHEMAQLPFDNGFDPRGVENRKRNGEIIGIFPSVIPYVPTLYFPKGTYLISDTLHYEHEFLNNTGGGELCSQIRFKGEDAASTVIRLQDASPGFSGESPKPMVQFLKGKGSNVAMSNYFEDLSLDCGKKNSSSVGLDFFCNNSGAVRNVNIRSGDGRGAAGLLLGHGNYSGVLLKNISVEGFDSGLYIDAYKGTMFVAAESFRLKDQLRESVFAGSPCISLRDFHCSGAPCAVSMGSHHGHLVMVDSELDGKGAHAIDVSDGTAYFSKIKVRGFDQVASRGGELPFELEECTFGDGKLLSSDRAPGSMDRLPVESPPVYPEGGHCRCEVNDFGAVADGSVDASAAIQEALNSGAAEVHFGAGKYQLDAPVQVPSHVKRLSFHFCDLVTGPHLRDQEKAGIFVIDEESESPLWIEDLFTWEQFCGDCITFVHACTRTLVIEDVHTQTMSLYRNDVPGGKVFLENAACTTGVIPGTEDHGRICMHFTGQQVWARQLNPERGHPMVINDGGSLWVMGFKTEDDATGFLTINGGQTELLGGILNFGGDQHPAFDAQDSWLRASASSNSWEGQIFKKVVRDRNGERLFEIKGAELPNRNYTGPRAKLFNLPLYASPAVPGT
ncbi:glycosyl hydrolase family 28-related protein [Kiritimatiellaeota bacterium B1221]|nr:glycosyl hydrolase family 28-related protein [Kiritimatiellaeota bacterium B1221]